MKKDDQKEAAKVIKASLELQQKVGTGTIDEKQVKQAQTVIDTNEVDFAPLAKPLIDQLSQALSVAKNGNGADKKVVEQITLPIMNLKANAATFNYPLISDMTGTVLNLVEHVGKVDHEIVEIVKNLNKAIMIVVSKKLTGKNAKMGEPLAREFRDVCKRYIDRRC